MVDNPRPSALTDPPAVIALRGGPHDGAEVLVASLGWPPPATVTVTGDAPPADLYELHRLDVAGRPIGWAYLWRGQC